MSAGSRGLRLVGALGAAVLATNLAACMFALDFDELQEGDGGTGTTPVSLNDAGGALAQATCDRLERCAGPALPILFGDVDCVDRSGKAYQNSILDGAELLSKETFEYHPSLLNACVEAIRNRPCEQVGPIAECAAALEGKVAQGGACVHPLECADGLYCDSTSECPGTCLPDLLEGAECRGNECAANLDCVSSATSKVCSPIVSTVGAPCENGEPPCALGMLCLSKGDSTPGMCQSVDQTFDGDLGGSCNTRNGPFCNEGLVCAFDSFAALFSTGQGKCSNPSSADAPCKVSVPDPCPVGWYCRPNPEPPQTIDGVCAPLPGALDPCAPELAVVKAPCLAGNVCVTVGTAKVCQPITDNGNQCSSDATCYSGYCLNNECSPLACEAT